MKDLEVGDKIIALYDISDKVHEKFSCPNGLPLKGHIYLVSGISPNSRRISLAGLPVYDKFLNCELKWCRSGFRKIVPLSERSKNKNDYI